MSLSKWFLLSRQVVFGGWNQLSGKKESSVGTGEPRDLHATGSPGESEKPII